MAEAEPTALIVDDDPAIRVALENLLRSEITVKVHRGQVMRKMTALSLSDLTRMADKLQLLADQPPLTKV